MQTNKSIKNILSVVATLSLSACLQNVQTTDVTTSSSGSNSSASSGTNDSTFSVVTDPATTNTNSSQTADTTLPTTVTPGADFVGFLINKGVAKTNSTSLHLDFYEPFFAAQLKVSYGSTCQGGTWVDNIDALDMTSNLTNQVVALSVQFIDNDQRLSSCYTQQIAIDQAGPDILFNSYPTASIESGTNVSIVFSVKDAFSDVASVTCSLQGNQKTCGAGTNTITIPSIAEGTYTFKVDATDSYGQTSTKSITWQVTSLYKNLSQKVAVTDNKSVDILIVIDNSGSMAYEQKSMAARTSKFLEVLRGLDYQIAITTTDPRNINLGDGRFVPLKGTCNQYIITSNMNEATAQKLLSDTLQRPETGSGDEQSIYATTRVVERAVADPKSIYAQFFRPGAQFATVVISDEDESENGVKNDPNNLLNLIKTSFGGNKSFSFHSIITRPGDVACKNSNGYAYGYRYSDFSKLTGGIIGDVCATDYASQLQGVAQGVRNTLKTITLSCKPVVDSFHNIVVLKDGVAYSPKFTLSGLNIAYDDVLPTGNYEILYSCLK